MTASLKYSDLTMREKSAVDALRLLDGESRNREQNFLAIVSGYRARVAELTDALDTLRLVVGLTAFKYESQRAVLQEAVDKANAVLGGVSPTPHPYTVRLEKLAKDLNEYRKCAHGRKITNESGASRLYNGNEFTGAVASRTKN